MVGRLGAGCFLTPPGASEVTGEVPQSPGVGGGRAPSGPARHTGLHVGYRWEWPLGQGSAQSREPLVSRHHTDGLSDWVTPKTSDLRPAAACRRRCGDLRIPGGCPGPGARGQRWGGAALCAASLEPRPLCAGRGQTLGHRFTSKDQPCQWGAGRCPHGPTGPPFFCPIKWP